MLFLEAHKTAPRQIVLDLDATDDPLHGHQEGRFFHGYYACYCYLPLYVFCASQLLAAKLGRSKIDASAGAVEEVAGIIVQIRARVIVFSGAQLHETVPNTTDLAVQHRFPHGPPGRRHRRSWRAQSGFARTGTTVRDYLRAADLQHLPEDVIALYDDDSASGDRVLLFRRSVRE